MIPTRPASAGFKNSTSTRYEKPLAVEVFRFVQVPHLLNWAAQFISFNYFFVHQKMLDGKKVTFET